ncbi:hypothetical protein NEUTE1DRAFT_98658 [Neurospora tetrasperma FGSC 2508]|uniref:Uncharacterized protein n=1 Tax=Neurospora tetrasperma (strain FGSC 2508 / ATCC MYA-4615 / P0657) TaxID=510951 RepID=F8ME34_NEUT8|nr:uncharacterized protein NEUTE1DRAFT_98658 [Neurospora tetrasperma FGSC 2508]EGO61569.1 hypothetical protein NEUTE1DRAFT_98658 [Neurospora tetrasperma FGSC 2508]EGZ74389.1 hypothetical protein NEUTE2DRAFT_125371 [Neurospora tetrasperma FGSC 2509]
MFPSNFQHPLSFRDHKLSPEEQHACANGTATTLEHSIGRDYLASRADCPVKRMPLDPKQDMEKEMHMQPSNHLEGDPPPTSNKIPLFTARPDSARYDVHALTDDFDATQALSTLNLAMRISPCPRPPEKITPETGVLKKDLQQLDAPPRRSTSNTPTQSTRSI